MWPSVQQPISKDKNVMTRARKYHSKNNYLILRSKSHEGNYGMRHTALWSWGILFKPNKVDRDQIQRTGCLCKSRVLPTLYISRMHARYADVLDTKVKLCKAHPSTIN